MKACVCAADLAKPEVTVEHRGGCPTNLEPKADVRLHKLGPQCTKALTPAEPSPRSSPQAQAALPPGTLVAKSLKTLLRTLTMIQRPDSWVFPHTYKTQLTRSFAENQMVKTTRQFLAGTVPKLRVQLGNVNFSFTGGPKVALIDLKNKQCLPGPEKLKNPVLQLGLNMNF